MLSTGKNSARNFVSMKLHSIVIVLTLIMAILVPTRHAYIPITYKLVLELVSWFKARAGCGCLGMQLARMETHEQNVAIHNTV